MDLPAAHAAVDAKKPDNKPGKAVKPPACVAGVDGCAKVGGPLPRDAHRLRLPPYIFSAAAVSSQSPPQLQN